MACLAPVRRPHTRSHWTLFSFSSTVSIYRDVIFLQTSHGRSRKDQKNPLAFSDTLTFYQYPSVFDLPFITVTRHGKALERKARDPARFHLFSIHSRAPAFMSSWLVSTDLPCISPIPHGRHYSAPTRFGRRHLKYFLVFINEVGGTQRWRNMSRYGDMMESEDIGYIGAGCMGWRLEEPAVARPLTGFKGKYWQCDE